jgi:alpha-ketoglutarate-dependent taurine dioxygenase
LGPVGLLLHAPPGGCELADVPVPRLRELAEEHLLVVLRGFAPLGPDELERYAAAWGPLLGWNFGNVLDLVVHEEPKNYLFTNGSVPFHWDGAFARAVPRWQVFQCVQAPSPGAGGETLFADTNRIWEGATAEQRARWEAVTLTYATDKVAHYGGRITVPLAATHPGTGRRILRFAEPPNETTAELNPLVVEAGGLGGESFADLLRELRALLYDPRYCYAHPWEGGDFLVADNQALLHGRKAFRQHSPRHLRRVHVL